MERLRYKRARRLRRHHIFRKRRRIYAIMGDWKLAVRLTHHFAICPGSCYMCRNPRRWMRGKASLTFAELKARDSFREQLRELQLLE